MFPYSYKKGDILYFKDTGLMVRFLKYNEFSDDFLMEILKPSHTGGHFFIRHFDGTGRNLIRMIVNHVRTRNPEVVTDNELIRELID